MQNKQSYQTKSSERLSYGIYFLGQNILWAYAGKVSTYLLDIGLTPEVASAILLGPKVWDAINDTLFGYLIDKVNPKNNQKFLPWIKAGTALVGIATILMFSIPASLENENFKIAWFIVGYILFDLFYTLIDAPVYALPTVMTTNIQERTSLLSLNRVWGIAGSLAGSVLIPLIRPKTGWFIGSIIFCVLATALMLPLIFLAKERTVAMNEEKQKNYSIGEMFRYLFSNKYLFMAIVMLFLVGICSVESTLSTIVARNCFADESKESVVALAMSVPVGVVALLLPTLTKKFDKYYLLLAGMILGLFGGVSLYFVGYGNDIVAMILLVIKGIGNSIYTIISYMLIADSVEYGAYKSGTRAAGISFSLQTFITKFKNAIIGSVSLIILGIFGYDSSLAENAIQAPGVVNGIWSVFTLLPAMGYLISVILLLFFYKLRDKDVELMARFNQGEQLEKAEIEHLQKRYGVSNH